ncbi:N-formylglutamate amidohydrolase [Allosphingosinicella vermicomposti]|uniref:N-formylglutamate amidohydrolase n=1 Tax=Allosphingosinicella vermicomposti TaxID=614671 RepID=UPI000D0E6D25|nr:N-formylglutamate amidohydrolase [Allosphingosinicella vermicomposti]
MNVAEFIAGADHGLLLVADHASNHVPDDIDLGIDPALFNEHIAVDIGIDPLARIVAARLQCPAILARVSRLVVDLHRHEHELAAIPPISDGHVVPANTDLHAEGREARIARFHRPYHALIEEKVKALAPRMLFTLHSFTPRLRTEPEKARPWEVGILYNQDARAARFAIDLLRARGIPTGDNEPYSGKLLNATMDRHAESRGLPYLAIEVRQDLICDAAGVARWADILVPVIRETHDALA